MNRAFSALAVVPRGLTQASGGYQGRRPGSYEARPEAGQRPGKNAKAGIFFSLFCKNRTFAAIDVVGGWNVVVAGAGCDAQQTWQMYENIWQK